ncbi:hypothetical protein ACWENQ_40400 [Nonomuraea sp. NPDC004354]
MKTVQLALGHSSPMVALNTYVREWPEAHEKTRALVDSVLDRVPRMRLPALAAQVSAVINSPFSGSS